MNYTPNSLHNILPLWDGIAAEVQRHRTAERDAIQAAINAGEMLNEAKALCSHGEWLPRLAAIKLNPRTAQRWMRLAKLGVKCDPVSLLGGVNATLRLWATMPPGSTAEDLEDRLFTTAVQSCMLIALEWTVAEMEHLLVIQQRAVEANELTAQALESAPAITDEIKGAISACDELTAAVDEIRPFVMDRNLAISEAVNGLRAALPKGRKAVMDGLPGIRVDGYAKAPESGEHKIWGLTSWNRVFSQTGPVMAGSPLPAMKARCIRRLRQVTRRAGAQRRSREAA